MDSNDTEHPDGNAHGHIDPFSLKRHSMPHSISSKVDTSVFVSVDCIFSILYSTFGGYNGDSLHAEGFVMSKEQGNNQDGSLADVIVISGMSGSGKSVVLNMLEDLRWYCADNLPASLLPAFVQEMKLTAAKEGEQTQPVAVGIDVRNHLDALAQLPEMLADIGEKGLSYFLLFMDASDDVLIRRFSETRRRHPLSSEGTPLADAIMEERRLLRPLKHLADKVVDSSKLNVHQLRRLVVKALAATDALHPTLLFESFAYKRGIPEDADFVFDARGLPNPHWEPGLRPLSGRDAPVQAFFEQQEDMQAYLGDLEAFLLRWLSAPSHASRSYFTVAVGCTGGRHRSVYLADALAKRARDQGHAYVASFHRELG